ncbi:19714_t:CDS:2, partial [Gigaspora rosea]
MPAEADVFPFNASIKQAEFLGKEPMPLLKKFRVISLNTNNVFLCALIYYSYLEAQHIETGELFAVKIINKKLMQGRENMVRNEIMVLKKISQGHRNILTLHDYFETMNN